MSISIDTITTGTTNGTGMFDKLMVSITAQLKADAVKNKITGPEFATVYLGALQAAMELAVKLAVVEQESAITEQKLLLAKEEVKAAQANYALIAKQEALLDAQINQVNISTNKTESERQLIVAEINATQISANKTEAERQLVVQKIKSERAQTEDNVATSNSVIGKQLQVQSAQIIDTQNNARVKENTANKLESERQLLNQRLVTERAQTQDNVAGSNSVVGKQLNLHQAQADGYKADELNKAVKLMLQAWVTQRSTDPTTTPAATYGFSTGNTLNSVRKMLQDAGVTGI